MTHVRRHRIRLILLAVLAACGSGAAPAGPEPSGQARLEVENRASVDMDIFALREGQRVRLGLAPGSRTTVFSLPPAITAGATFLRFEAQPIGGRGEAVVSDAITVRPGDIITFPIPPQ